MEYHQLLVIMTAIFSFVTLFTSIGLLIKKKYRFFIENIVSYIFYLIFLILQYKLRFQINAFIIMLVLITFIGNNLVGQYLDLYNSSKYYDRFLHAFGSFSFSIFFYLILEKITIHMISPKFYNSILIAMIGISLGCIFEIYEFISDSTSTSNLKNQHGLKDTNFDLISDIIGSVIAGIISSLMF